MGQLYEAVQAVDGLIQQKNLDDFKTRGLISMEAGFFLAIVGPNTEDDAERIVSLRRAAEKVLGEPMPF